MKRVFSPNKSSSPICYSSATIESLERPDVAEDSSSLISGHVFDDGRFAWLVRGSSIEVVNTSDGSRRAAWRFGSQSSNKVISCVREYTMEDGVKLLVGLKDLSGGSSSPGMVCVFDPWVSRVVRAIDVPYPVTALECVKSDGGAHAQSTLLSFHLKLFFGTAAVATEQGHTYLVDLRSDDATEEFNELNPSPLEIINPRSQNLADAREQSHINGTHLAFELGGQFHGSGKFSYANQESEDVKIFPAGNIFVTALKYVPEATSLAVGYNFGCFHIWSLETLSLVYSSQLEQYVSAITHFTYQEPENDPRNCCYMWVARGPLTTDEQAEMPATLTLYQLIFSSRHNLTGFGTVYRDLGGCGRRFEHQLTADAHHLADATSVGSKVICCYTLCRENTSLDLSKLEEAREEEGAKTRDLTLMVCVWESPSHDQLARPTCHLGIFDINRWYHSQMLPSIRDAMFGSKHPTCSFFAFFSLAEVLDIASPDGIVDIFVDKSSLSRFCSGTEPAQEQHFWPAALKFDTCSLLETSIVKSTFLGIQRQILADLSLQGSTGQLPDPHEYFNMCWMAGLLPRNFDISKPQEKSFHYEALLSVAMEHNLVSFITSLIQKLGSDNVTHTGCSLRLILDWAWSNVVSSKEQLDLLCVPLFDGGGGTPDDHMLGMLDDMWIKLQNLMVIFQALIYQTAPTTEQGVQDMESKHNVVSILGEYLQVLLWFIRHGLLPEYSEESGSAVHRGGYLGVSLGKAYEARRAEVQRCGISDRTSGGLMIDRLLDELAHQWHPPDDSSQFPPASLHGLCSLYLLQDTALEKKNAIVYYLLLDICEFDVELDRQQVAERFSKAFGMPRGLTTLIKAFWYLDHKDFKQAVSCLVDPCVDTELGPWQNSYIIKTLLFQGQVKTALYYMKTAQPTMHSVDDVRLHLTVRIANGLVTEAFGFQRDHRDPSSDMELLHHFFNGCHQTGNMSKLMQLPFSNIEEECFVEFLEQESFPASRELLVMYYLQRGRYVEGIRLNELLKHELQEGVEEPVILERAKVRNAIVDGYIKCLPSIQRKLIFGPDKPAARPTSCKEVPRPRPLSTVVHPANKARPVTHATILTSVMEKVEESRVPGLPQTKASPFVCTPLTPKLKSNLRDSNRVVVAAVTNPEVPELSFKERRSPKASFGSPSFLERKRNQHLYSGAEALRLLSTPTVVKRSSSRADAISEPTVATPQSILVTRVLRRTSPRPSPAASPPMTRRGSYEQPSQPKPDSAMKKLAKDVEDNLVTPSRRIRFAVEDSPSPPRAPSVSPQPLYPVLPAMVDDSVLSNDSSMASGTGDDFTDAMDTSPGHVISHDVDNSLRLELSHESEDEEETEVQITAAVVDLTHSQDSDIEDEEPPEEEDYSSYELDDSDAADESEDEGMARVNVFQQREAAEADLRDARQSVREVLRTPSPRQSPDPKIGREQSVSPTPITTTSQHSPLQEHPPSPFTETATTQIDLSPVKLPPPSVSSPPPTSPEVVSSPAKASPPRTSPVKSTPPKTVVSPPDASPISRPTVSQLLAQQPSLTMTPPKSPELSVRIQRIQTPAMEPRDQQQDSYIFAPPVVLRETSAHQGHPAAALLEGTTTPMRMSSSEVQTTPYMFSPPVTRSAMKKRRSSDLSHHISLRPRDSSGHVTPHQSPSDSPISFVTPGPVRSPRTRRRSEPRRVIPQQPQHRMTLRSRSGPQTRSTRSALLPPAPE